MRILILLLIASTSLSAQYGLTKSKLIAVGSKTHTYNWAGSTDFHNIKEELQKRMYVSVASKDSAALRAVIDSARFHANSTSHILLINNAVTATIETRGVKYAKTFGTYKITKAKLIGFGLCVAGGATDGLLEGYHIDNRTSFERKYNAKRYGFWGSESWRMVYKGGNPDNGFKSPVHKWLGATDFYHIADDVRKVGYISGGLVIGISAGRTNQKLWHYAADFAISFALSAASKSIAYKYIRT